MKTNINRQSLANAYFYYEYEKLPALVAENKNLQHWCNKLAGRSSSTPINAEYIFHCSMAARLKRKARS